MSRDQIGGADNNDNDDNNVIHIVSLRCEVARSKVRGACNRWFSDIAHSVNLLTDLLTY